MNCNWRAPIPCFQSLLLVPLVEDPKLTKNGLGRGILFWGWIFGEGLGLSGKLEGLILLLGDPFSDEDGLVIPLVWLYVCDSCKIIKAIISIIMIVLFIISGRILYWTFPVGGHWNGQAQASYKRIHDNRGTIFDARTNIEVGKNYLLFSRLSWILFKSPPTWFE